MQQQQSINNGLVVDCRDQKLGDVNISQFLNFFLVASMGDVVGELILSNNRLSKVPAEIRFFTSLSYVNLRNNEIGSVESGTFIFPDKGTNLFTRFSLYLVVVVVFKILFYFQIL